MKRLYLFETRRQWFLKNWICCKNALSFYQTGLIFVQIDLLGFWDIAEIYFREIGFC